MSSAFFSRSGILQKVVLGQIVEGTRSLLENGELRFVFVPFAADELDALLNIADERRYPGERSASGACGSRAPECAL